MDSEALLRLETTSVSTATSHLLESIPISVVCGRCNIGSVRVSARNDRKWKKMKVIMYLPIEQLGEILPAGEFIFDRYET